MRSVLRAPELIIHIPVELNLLRGMDPILPVRSGRGSVSQGLCRADVIVAPDEIEGYIGLSNDAHVRLCQRNSD